jgi:hypothetical protein
MGLHVTAGHLRNVTCSYSLVQSTANFPKFLWPTFKFWSRKVMSSRFHAEELQIWAATFQRFNRHRNTATGIFSPQICSQLFLKSLRGFDTMCNRDPPEVLIDHTTNR